MKCLAEVRTLYTAPGTAVELQGFQEQLVLVLGPLLPLLCYRVRLSRLNGKIQECELDVRKGCSFTRFALCSGTLICKQTSIVP